MRVLWLVSITLPDAAAAFGLQAGLGGGWLLGQLNEMKKRCTLAVCAVNPAAKQICQAEVDGVEYILLPTGSELEFRTVVFSWQPLLVHIWGTEYPAARTLFAECDPERTLISIQGLMGECARHLLDGVPAGVTHSGPLRRMVNRALPCALPDVQQEEFWALGQSEAALLQNARHVSGRTEWDRDRLRALAPGAVYHPCGETLRPAFYEGRWQRPQGDPVLFLSQGNYPLKGLHRLLPALALVKKRYPGVRLRIAGWPPLDKGALLRPFIRAMFPYQTYCQRLQKQLGLTGCVEYTGPLSAEQMRAEYLACQASVLCSSIENSPNSLGEAMLLGVPCVAARVGGVPSMAEDGREALLCDAADPEALAAAILRILDDDALAETLSENARLRAARQHDPAANAQTLYAIYGQLAEGGGGA